MATGDRFIVDVGAHDGTDTAQYLELGFTVAAIEADPLKADTLKERFRSEIGTGRCIVFGCGVGKERATLNFYRSKNDGGSSSFNKDFAGVGAEVIQVEVMPLQEILEKIGRIPYYIKCDIEGYDYAALSTLRRTMAPEYISAEIQNTPELLDLFISLEYRRFKLIVQPYGTTSEDIYNRDIGWRLLRKVTRKFPVLHAGVRALPQFLRPKTEWEAENNAISSGPFGEATPGKWEPAGKTRSKLLRIMRHAREASDGRAWVDLHAAR